MDVPDASSDYIVFLHIGMKKSLLTGMHGYGFCCKKGKRGKYMCCLVFKQGLHKEKTCAILIILFKSENVKKNSVQTYKPYLWTKIPWQCWMHQMMLWPVHLSISTLWDPLSGNKRGMNKKHIIVKTTSLPPILWVVKETHPRSQAQHQAKPSKSTWPSIW